MVTKQEQLEWLAKTHEEWPYIGSVMIMSDKSIGAYYGAPMPGCHFVSVTEWQQERDRIAEMNAMTMQMCNIKPLGGDEMSGKPEADNSWHERGKLPPVGCECEWVDDSGVEGADGVCYPDVGDVVFVCAHKETPGGNVIAIFTWPNGSYGLHVAASRMPADFRPLRTERERAIDTLIDIICAEGYFTRRDGGARKIAERIYDAWLLK